MFRIFFFLYHIEIIIIVRDCSHIFIVDCTVFFYQWKIFNKNKHKFIVVNHKKQEIFNVTFMKYINSFCYVQKQIDRILQFYRIFVKIYVNDIVIFFKNFEKTCSTFTSNVFRIKTKWHFDEIVQKVFELFYCSFFKSKNWFIKIDHYKTKTCCHFQIEIFQNFMIIETLFWIHRLIQKIRKMLCKNFGIFSKSKNDIIWKNSSSKQCQKHLCFSYVFEKWKTYITFQNALKKREKFFHFKFKPRFIH